MKSVKSKKSTVERTHEEVGLKILGEQAPVGVCIIQDGKFCYVNPYFSIGIGYTAEELMGKDSREIVAPEDRERVRKNTIKMLKGEPLLPYQFRAVHKDGSTRWVMATVKPIQYHGREAALGIYMEATERMQMEDRLEESEQKYRLLLETSQDYIVQMDREGRYLVANPATARSLGVSMEELIGKTMSDVMPPEVAQLRLGNIRRVLDEWQPRIFEDARAGRHFKHMLIPMKTSGSKEVAHVISRDITERKKAEEALRQSEERYRPILEEMEGICFEVDLGGHFTFVNNSVCSNLGYSREELMGMSYKKFTLEDDAESVQRVFNEVYQTGVPNKGFLWKIIRRDDVQGFVETSVSLLRNDKGEVIGFRGVGRDVTERTNMEEMIGLQRAYFQQLFDTCPDAIAMTDSDAKVSEVNNGFEALFGYTAEESRGRFVDELIVPKDSVKESAALSQAVFDGKIVRKETVRRRRDGSLVAVSILAYPIRFNEKLVGGYVIYSDITRRKEMEETLRQSEENYRTLFDSSVIGTFVLDAETGKVVMCNQAAAKMFGFSSVDEAIGVKASDFAFPDDKERVLEIIAKELFEQDLRRTHELRMVTNDGRTIWISVTGSRIMHKGKLAGLVSFTDITEQKRQSERLMIADRLVSLGELAAGAAHELNNPLTSIIGFSQLLLEKDIPDDIREDLKLICSEAQRAAAVTKDLLIFARGRPPMRQPNQINTIIEGALKLRSYEQKASGIEIRKQLSHNLPEVMVDYSQMQQVFLNIIINAEFFMIEAHKKGTLTITTRRQNGRLKISFGDDGPGIAPENLTRIFDPFFTTKKAGKGTGLGLSICHGIVTEHGGQIYARSQQGKGTTIVVELPINGRDHIAGMP